MRRSGLGRRVGTALVLALLVTGVLIAAFAGGQGREESRSVDSPSPQGRLAARLLLLFAGSGHGGNPSRSNFFSH